MIDSLFFFFSVEWHPAHAGITFGHLFCLLITMPCHEDDHQSDDCFLSGTLGKVFYIVLTIDSSEVPSAHGLAHEGPASAAPDI